MTTQFIPDQGDEPIVETNDSPGCRLRGARQTRGLSVEQAAAQLHLTPDTILALERDDYAALQGHVFVIGYMRNYARLVMLDAEPLLDKYRATATEESVAQPLGHAPLQQQPRSSRFPIKLFGGLAIVAGIGALTFFWWNSQYGSGPEPGPESGPVDIQTTPEMTSPLSMEDNKDSAGPLMAAAEAPVEPEPQASALSPAEMSMSAPGQDSETIPTEREDPPATLTTDHALEPIAEQAMETTESSAVSQPSPSTPNTAMPKTVAETEAPPAAEPVEGEIVMAFSGPCWVDIRDSERKFKLFGEMSKDDRHVLEGTPPYSMILGNAAAVSITVGGAPFDLSDIARGNVARFTLDPAQLP